MSAQAPRKKRHTGLIVLAITIALVMAVEGYVLIVAFVSPTGSKAISEKIAQAQHSWEGSQESPGIKQRTGQALSDFYQNDVRTLWAIPSPAPGANTFAECGTCHKDFVTKARFTDVYMNHPVHGQAGVGCPTCHTSVQHPHPTPPAEAVCAKCHAQVQLKKQCDFCHPPGSLPHFYLLGYPRNQAVNCAVCHPQDSFAQATPERLVHPGPFDGSQQAICLQCHQKQTSASVTTPACQDCHGSPHPPDWINSHGRAAGVTETGFTGCASCHTDPTWCAMLCHPLDSPTAKYPLPTEVPSP